jgi:hypothetical protein
MKQAILTVLSLGLLGSIASAQPGPVDQPIEETTSGGYGEMGGNPYGRDRMMGEYGVRRIDPRQTQKLIEGWKNSKEGAEREKLETELRALLRREFASRLAVHEREIKKLEEKVRQLRERLALRKDKQEDIVDHRLQQILRDAQGLGWGSEGAHGNDFSAYSPATDAPTAESDLLLAPMAGEPLDEAEAPDDLFGEASSADTEPATTRN